MDLWIGNFRHLPNRPKRIQGVIIITLRRYNVCDVDTNNM
jgi:hypothetical protein